MVEALCDLVSIVEARSRLPLSVDQTFRLRSRDWRVLVLPLTGSLIGIIGACKVLAFDVEMIHHPFSVVAYQNYRRWAIALLATDLAINWIVTLMIIGRLWWIGHCAAVASPIGGRRPNRFATVILAFVESGSILSITLAFYIGFWISENVSWSFSLLGFQRANRGRDF